MDAVAFPDDLDLARSALAGDDDAVRRVHALCAEVVPAALARSRVPSSWSDEIAQRVRTRLLVGETPRLAGYTGRGPLRAWLKVAALRTGLDLARRGRREETLEERILEATPGEDGPELQYLKAHYQDRFKAAFAAALEDLSDRDRRVLKLRILDGLNIDAIGALHGVHRATAARWIDKAREALGAGVRRRLERELAGDAKELDSILRLIRSRIDLSLQRRLAPGG